MANPLTGAQLVINNEVVSYISNSLVYDLGNAERVVTTQVVGNGAVENVVTENFETSKSKVMFDLKTTTENEGFLLNWIDNVDGNVLKVLSKDGVTRVFSKAVVINKPEFNTGSDGVISVEFESMAVVIG